ncbi:MAG: Gfo/Idh/MocA family oxidoreductase [Planctomycetes bacterium]|nr:Gfo/Idh/MocA family oxidoreductase [Planctomycetota bacterium]MBL7042080.1 Gfo/Idh/MocA family oxidoreductase [Pirellulaceae bacterium]
MARTTRRKFLQTTAAAGVGFWVAGGVAPKRSFAANETINFACVGVGGKGRSDSRDAARHGNIVAICDCDENTLNKAAAGFKGAQKFFDYRKMFDEVGKSIDAVTVSTPDHNHAPAAIRAMKLGKHCFTQKPLTHTIYEARRMGEVAREMKVATEMGNQGTANNDLRKSAAFVQGGGLGDVKEVHVWTNRPIWPQGLGRPEGEDPVPEGVNWESWIGPAPMRPFKGGVYHPFKWRGWWDFGTGALGDMACHTLNMCFAALSLQDPISVQANTSGHNKETYPAWSVITFEYPANDKRGPVTLTWYDGGKLPPEELIKGSKEQRISRSGALMVGSKGTIYAPGDYADRAELIGQGGLPDVEYERSPGHFDEWIRAIKEGKPAMSNFPDYAGPLTETILLGNLAVWAAPEAEQTGKKIEWDAKNLVATNAPEVMPIVKKDYRKGWELEKIAEA